MRKRLTILLYFIMLAGLVYGQCNNASSFASHNMANDGSVEEVTACTFTGEYADVTNLIIGNDYEFDLEMGGPASVGYITVIDAADGVTVLAHGNAPLTVAAITVAAVELHYNDDASCAAAIAGCFEAYAQCVSAACSPSPPPANDLCGNAIVVACTDMVSGDTTNATSTDDPGSCVTPAGAPGVWYKFIGDGNNVTASLCGSSFDTMIQIYSGACGTLTCIGGNDDFCAMQSQISFNTAIGTDYFIYVYGNGSSVGAFDLEITCVPAVPVPPNDLCANATALVCGTPIIGETVVGASGAGTSSCNGSIGNNVWYTWTGTGDIIDLTVTTDGTLEAQLDVYESADGTCGTNVCNPTFTNGGNGANPVTTTFNSVAGQVYYFNVGPWFDGSPEGTFDIELTCTPPPPTPPNDLCADAITVVCGDVVSGDTTAATETGEETTFCGTSESGAGVWYHFIGTGDVVTASLCGSAYDTRIQIWEGSCGTLTCVDGNDDTCGIASEVSFPSTVGTDYYIYVYGTATSRGMFDLSISCCTNPPVFDLLDGGNNCPTDEFFIDVDVTSVGDASNVDISDGTTTYFTSVGIGTHNIGPFVTGQSVTVTVSDSATAACLATDIYVIPPCPPSNDDCAGAIAVSCGQSYTGSTATATNNDQPGACGGIGNTISGGVWYVYTGTGNSVTASLCASSYDTNIKVFSGACGALTCVDGDEDSCGGAGDFESTVTFATTLGVDYYIYIHGFNTETGNYDLFMDCAYPVAPGVSACTAGLNTEDISSANGNDNTFVPFFDASGNIICEINANGNQLGLTSVSLYVESAASRLISGQHYSPRNVAITVANQPSTNVDVRFYMPKAEFDAWAAVDPNVTTILDVTAYKENNNCNAILNPPFGGIYTQIASSANYGSVPDYSVDFSVPSFSNFFFAGPLVLSAELTLFDAYQDGKTNLITWETNSEHSIKYFQVERSRTGTIWENHGNVQSLGETQQTRNYSWIDDNPPPRSFYRLRILDVDGSAEYSDVVLVDRTLVPVEEIRIYPNPVQNWVLIDSPTPSSIQYVELIDVNGKIMFQSQLKGRTLNLEHLSAGIYILRIVKDDGISIHKIVKQ